MSFKAARAVTERNLVSKIIKGKKERKEGREGEREGGKGIEKGKEKSSFNLLWLLYIPPWKPFLTMLLKIKLHFFLSLF